MTVIRESLLIAGTQEELFALTQDYDARKKWDIFADRYQFHDGASGPAPGVELTVFASNGTQMRVRYVSFQRPRVAAIEMVKGPAIFRSFAGAWRFTAAGEGFTRVEFTYHIVAGLGLLRYLLQPLLNLSFRRHSRRRLRQLRAWQIRQKGQTT